MLPNPTLRKVVQISEESLPSVHVPLILGNEFFILTQQDVRKIEDTRLFTISKLMPNGVLKTQDAQDANDWLQQCLRQENLLGNQNFYKITSGQGSQQQAMPQSPQQTCPNCGISYPQPMDVSTTACNTVASIEEQLQWNKREHTSAPFPMTYSQATSTTEINGKQPDIKDNPNKSTCSCCKICQENEKLKNMINKTTNTEERQFDANKLLDAREQLKKKKISFSFT